MNQNAALSAARQENPSAPEAAVVIAAAAATMAPNARCSPLRAPNAARLPKYPLNPEATDRYIAAIATGRKPPAGNSGTS